MVSVHFSDGEWATDAFSINEFPPDHIVFQWHAKHSMAALPFPDASGVAFLLVLLWCYEAEQLEHQALQLRWYFNGKPIKVSSALFFFYFPKQFLHSCTLALQTKPFVKGQALTMAGSRPAL